MSRQIRNKIIKDLFDSRSYKFHIKLYNKKIKNKNNDKFKKLQEDIDELKKISKISIVSNERGEYVNQDFENFKEEFNGFKKMTTGMNSLILGCIVVISVVTLYK